MNADREDTGRDGRRQKHPGLLKPLVIDLIKKGIQPTELTQDKPKPLPQKTCISEF
jgi:hypothetical protein